MGNFTSWEDRMAEYLREFLANPSGTVKVPVGEAVEMSRAARDFETMLRTAPEKDADRIAEAVRFLSAVDLDAVRKVEEELADRLEAAIETIEEVGWHVEAASEGKRVEAMPPPGTPDPSLMHALMERVGTPREVLLARQREVAPVEEEEKPKT